MLIPSFKKGAGFLFLRQKIERLTTDKLLVINAVGKALNITFQKNVRSFRISSEANFGLVIFRKARRRWPQVVKNSSSSLF